MAGKKIASFAFVGAEEIASPVSRALEQAGLSKAPSPASADAVLTYFTNIPSLEEAYYGSDGILQGSGEGTLFIDLSPSTVTFARELYAIASSYGCNAVDAPLVVRGAACPSGIFSNPSSLGILAGAEKDAFASARPLLEAFARTVFWVGKPGAGQAAKAAATFQSAAALVGIVEGYSALARSESPVDLEDLREFFQAMGMLTDDQGLFFDALVEESYEGDYRLEHMMGELAAALSSVDDGDMIMPQAESAFRLMELLAMVGGVAYAPAALRLAFEDDEAGMRHGLDWSRAEGAYEQGHECSCGHDHENGHECSCGHDHDHGNPIAGFSFSAN